MPTLKLEDSTSSIEQETEPQNAPQTETFLKNVCRILGHSDPLEVRFNSEQNRWEWFCGRCKEIVYASEPVHYVPYGQDDTNKYNQRDYTWTYTSDSTYPQDYYTTQSSSSYVTYYDTNNTTTTTGYQGYVV